MFLIHYPLLCVSGYNFEKTNSFMAFTVSINMIAVLEAELFVQLEACAIVRPDLINYDLITKP